MTIAIAHQSPLQGAANVRSWQRDTFERRILPVIGITGGRGKSTVGRMIDAILGGAHLRTAIWTNLGVELRGRRQRAEISGWSLALGRLQAGTLDAGIQELHWSTINAVGLPPSMYPVFAITNLTGHHDGSPAAAPPIDAIRGAVRAAQAVQSGGVLVIGADDHGLAEAMGATDATLVITALSRDVPLLRRHLKQGGSGVWIEHDEIRSGTGNAFEVLCTVSELTCTLRGSAPFQVSNVLTAIATTRAIGVDTATTVCALRAFNSTPDILPGSFNVHHVESYQVVIDRLSPPWHLRTILRSINTRAQRRQVSVVGNLDCMLVTEAREIGRLLGRHLGAIIVHSNHDVRLVDAFRRGIASNPYPPLVIHLPTERRALNRALKTAHPDDIVLILTGEDPGPATRAIHRLRVPPPSALDGELVGS